MPRPIYMLCSETGSEDSQTRLLSHFKVIERVQISKITPDHQQPGKPVVLSTVKLRVTAVWMRNQDDPPEDEYEFETAFYLPPENKEIVVHTGRFFFGADGSLYRMLVMGEGPQFQAPGIFRSESRIRKVGRTAWLTQDYPIPIEDITPIAEVKPTEAEKNDK